jgi:hypothetical protein
MPPMGAGENDRRTPPSLFWRYNDRWEFTLDGAASHENALVDTYCTLEGTFVLKDGMSIVCSPNDGLTYAWEWNRVWLNPPYGRGLLEPFIQKADRENRLNGVIVVALVPVRTEQPWWHRYVVPAMREHRLTVDWLEGRVKYDGLETAAPFASCVLIWR